MVARERKRERLVEKYARKREALKRTINDMSVGHDERMAAVATLAELPRNSSRTRLRNRCEQTGRPHGYYRKFGLARNRLRQAAMNGEVPGLRKASW